MEFISEEYEPCAECEMKTYRKLIIGKVKFPICLKCCCGLWIKLDKVFKEQENTLLTESQ